MSKSLKWIDLSAHGVALIPAKMKSGKTALVIVGEGLDAQSPFKDGLRSLNFVPNPRGYFWFSLNYSTPEGVIKGISVSSFKKVFPKAIVREMTTDEINTAHISNKTKESDQTITSTAEKQKSTTSSKGKISAKAAKDIEIDLNQIKPIGINELGEKVFQNAGERFVIDPTNKRVYEHSGYFANARYLRAGRPTSVDGAALSSCMYGLINQIKNGGVLGLSDIENSAKVFFDIQNWEGMNETTRQSITKFIQTAIESAIVKEVELSSYRHTDHKGKVAVEAEALYERRPTYVDKNEWHRDLPPDISLLLGDLITEEHQNILLPFANQGGSILTTLKNSESKNIRALMDYKAPSFAAHFKIGKELNIAYDKFNYVNDNLADKSVDFIVGAMPGSAERTSMAIDNGSTERLDHFYAFKILNSLRENGRAVITIESDGYDGEVNSESKIFMDWLYANFKVDSIVDIDGGIYSKSGDYNAGRLIVIKGRHIVPLNVDYPSKVDVIRKRSELYTHIEAITERLNGKSQALQDDILDTESLSAAMARIQDSRGEEIQLNEYQSRYISMSSIGEVASMVPKNISEPVRMCFARFMKDAGTVDQFVQEKLQMDEEEMFLAFTPEQIDSIGLAIWRHEFKGKGFLIGDQTGKGKGRIIAGLLRYSALKGEKSVFLTKDAGLFQDIWRDIQDIGTADLFDPYLVNDKAVIYDNAGNIVATGSNSNNDVYIKNNSVLRNNLIMTSYSQINSSPKTERINGTLYTHPNKPDWHKEIVKDATLILDESHLAAGKSNTNKVVDKMLDNCNMITYSSATYSRHAKSMAIYRKLFPENLSTKEIEDALVKGKEPLQEILAATLVADGGMMRREHDLSRLTTNVTKAVDYQKRNEEACDAFAVFLSGFALLTGDISGAAEVVNKQIIANMLKAQASNGSNLAKIPSTKDIGYQSMSFGSQLHNLTKQFILALNVDVAADRAILAVQQGRKPVLGIENTGEALLKHIKDLYDEGTPMTGMPNIRHLLKRVVERNLMVSYINPLTNKTVYKSASELYTDPAKAKYFEDQIALLMADIDKLPPLPFSPIDSIIQKVEAAGIKIGEISGRSLHVEKGKNDLYTITSKKKPDKNSVVNAFNDGYLDCVIMTKSGATGTSLHAYEKFADQNQRELIEVQIFDDIVDRVQLLGRVNRIGQVVEPILTSIDSMVAGQTRLLAMANTKLARLSANTTANRDNSSQLETIDLLNNVGDTVCQRYLESNPTLRKRLFLAEEDIDDKNLQKGYENSLSRVVTSRLLLLPIKEQSAIYADLDFEFDAYIRECEAQGYNPLKRRELDVKATEVKRQKFNGASKTFYESEFDRPVEIVTIHYDIKRKALKSETICEMVTNGLRRVYQDPRVDSDDGSIVGMISEVEKLEKSLISETFSNDRGTFHQRFYDDTEYKEKLAERLKDSHINSTKKIHELLTWLKDKLEIINVGTIVEFDDYLSKVKGVITDIKFPRMGNEHMIAQYQLSIATPREGVILRSLADLYQGRGTVISIEKFELGTPLAGEFDRSKDESFVQERHLLSGNMFEAARFAASKKIGTPIIYTDTSGARLPAVLLSYDMSPNKLLEMPFTLDKSSTCADFLRCHETTKMCTSLEYKYNKDLIIMRDAGNKSRWKVTVPNNKAAGEMYFANNNLTNLTVNGWHTHSRNQIAVVTEKNLDAFISTIYSKGVRLYTPKNARTWLNDYEEGRIKVPSVGQNISDLNATTNPSMTPA